MNKKKLLKWSAITGVIILIGLSLGIIGYMYTKVNAFEKVFAGNVYIEDLAVGGLTKEEAKEKLEQDVLEKISKQSLVFTKEDISIEVPLSDLGLTYNIDEMIDEAFYVGHDGSFWEKYKILKDGMQEKKSFELSKTINEQTISEKLNNYAQEFYEAPINASYTRKSGTFIITKEVNGKKLNIESTEELAINALQEMEYANEEHVRVEVVMDTIIPECTEELLQKSQTLLSSFSTSYNNANANRNENLKVASKKITRMLLPDEIFYLSNQFEPFTEAAGYKSAGTIVNGKIEDSLGGGVCQVASTLYNSVLLTDLEIVMRQNHSLAVSYVPLGRDATYNTDTIDFRFKNNSGYPMYIEGYCANNEVIVNIYGNSNFKSQYDIKFESEVTEVIPAPATKYEDDSTLEEGKEVVETTAIDGKRVNLYKLYYANGVLEKRVLVNRSYYRPRAAVVKRGTKKKVEVVTEPESNSSATVPSTPETNITPSESPQNGTEEATGSIAVQQ